MELWARKSIRKKSGKTNCGGKYVKEKNGVTVLTDFRMIRFSDKGVRTYRFITCNFFYKFVYVCINVSPFSLLHLSHPLLFILLSYLYFFLYFFLSIF